MALAMIGAHEHEIQESTYLASEHESRISAEDVIGDPVPPDPVPAGAVLLPGNGGAEEVDGGELDEGMPVPGGGVLDGIPVPNNVELLAAG